MYKRYIDKYPGFWSLVIIIAIVVSMAIILGNNFYNQTIHKPYLRMEQQAIAMFENEKHVSNVKIISGNTGDRYYKGMDGTSLIYVLSDGKNNWKVKFSFNWQNFEVTKIVYILLDETNNTEKP